MFSATPTVFNLTCDYWMSPATPATGPATVSGIQCQLYVNVRGLLDITPGNTAAWNFPIFIKIPSTAVSEDGVNPKRGSIFRIDIPLSLGPLYWKARQWEYVHAGFPNEYVAVSVEQCSSSGGTPDPAR